MTEFTEGTYYYNEDFGDYIKVVSLDPFKVHKQKLGTFHEDRELYEQKLKDGIIYPVAEKY